MAGEGKGEIKATIIGELEFSRDTDKALLFYTMRLSMSAYTRAKLYANQPYLKLKKPQLYSVGSSDEDGNRNIKFINVNLVKIKIPSSNGKHRWILCRVKFGRKHIRVIKELIEKKMSYGAGITIKDNKFMLYVNVPLEIYAEKMRKTINSEVKPKHFAGFDFNSDRINMVIIDENGEIRDINNIHFPEVISHGFSRKKARTVRQEALSKLVKYAREHGVKYFIIEKLEKPKNKTKSRKANRKISKFALKEYLNQMKILAEKVNGKLVEVNPAYTSIDAIPIARKLGLDRHTASAYLIAIRGISLTKNHKNS